MAIQFYWFPLATLASLAQRRWSLSRWCDECGERGVGAAEFASLSIFVAFMGADFFYAELWSGATIDQQVRWATHHVACLVGSVYGCILCPPQGVPCLLSAIGSLINAAGVLINAASSLINATKSYAGQRNQEEVAIPWEL